jgi:hypothetical protein
MAYGQLPPACPPKAELTFQNVVIEYLILTLEALVLCLIIAFRYNYVRAFDRKFYSSTVSNTLWVVYFLFTAIRCVHVQWRGRHATASHVC